MDAMQQLAWDSESSAIVLGNRGGEVVVVDLDEPIAHVAKSDLARRGFEFLGIVGVHFCRLVRKHGFKVWTHQAVLAGHLKTGDATRTAWALNEMSGVLGF